jgi:epoxyqueuosine reductase QueG
MKILYRLLVTFPMNTDYEKFEIPNNFRLNENKATLRCNICKRTCAVDGGHDHNDKYHTNKSKTLEEILW